MKNDSGLSDIGAYAIIILIFVVMAGIIILGVIVPLTTQETVTLNVTGKDTYTTTNCDKDGCNSNIHNLIYTNGEILEFDDNLVLWVWGSQTSFSHIQQGKTYVFEVYGFNVPWINWYRTVKSYKDV